MIALSIFAVQVRAVDAKKILRLPKITAPKTKTIAVTDMLREIMALLRVIRGLFEQLL